MKTEHRQRGRGLRTLGTAALVAALATSSFLGLVPAAGAAATPVAAAAAAAVAPQMVSFDQQMIRLINTARAANGRSALTEARGLTTDAVWWSSQLGSGTTSPAFQLAHNPNAWTMVASNGASNRTSWGENVAWSSSTASSAQDVFTAYMNSPSHRANILSASYHYIGMGTVGGGHGLWNTTEFTDKVLPGQAVAVIAPPSLAVSKARAMVASWYLDVLGRPADAGALAARGAALVGGMSLPDQARSLQISTEGLDHLVGLYYTQYLHRAGDAGGLAARVAQLRAGTAPMSVAAGLLGSAEALNRAGGTNAAWVSFAFRSVLGRNPNATETTNWSGLASRSGLLYAATSLINTASGTTTRINGYYLKYLGRAGSAAGIAGWAALVRTSGDLKVQTGFLTSPEYVARHS